MIAPLLTAVTAAAALQAPAPQVEGPTVAPRPARIQIPAAELAGLDDATRAQLDLDIIYRDQASGDVQVLAVPTERALLVAAGVEHSVIHADERAFYAQRAANAPALALGAGSLGATLTPPYGSGSMGGYYTYSQIVSVLDQLSASFPGQVSAKQSIGQTLQGRDIWAFKISDNPGTDENEPEVRFDSLHHSREPQGFATSLWFALWMLDNYGTDPLATYLVDEREIWFVPVVNADGYAYNQLTDPNGGGLWRKNRRNNGGGDFGVDLNRNYPFQWGYDDSGSSPFAFSETYRGTSPASEPETQAMTQFIQDRNFASALSVHTFSNLWLHPFGYDFVLPTNINEYLEVSALQTEVNNYAVGSPPQILYTANGGTVDYEQDQTDTFSWTPEIGSQSDGFWPSPTRIVPLAEENLLAFQRTALLGGAWVRIDDTTIADLGDGDGNYEAGEAVEFTIALRNSGRDASGAVTLELLTSSPAATVTSGLVGLGSIASFADGGNAGQPLSLTIAGNATEGTSIPYSLRVSYEGLVQDIPGSISVGEERLLLRDNANTDFGWTIGLPSDTANTGNWELAVPIGTDNNGEDVAPGLDASAGANGQAFVTGNGGGSGGNDDVDDGLTTLISPRIDLTDFPGALLGYSRWFAIQSQIDDTFEISVSNDDGQSWTPLESVAGNQNSWTDVSFTIQDTLPLTDAMRLRFIAQDDPNNSLLEAAIDDLEVRGFGSAPRIVRYGDAEVGDSVGLGFSGEPNALVLLYVAGQPSSLILPGLIGTIELDVTQTKLVTTQILGNGGRLLLDSPIPQNPALTGATFFLQGIQAAGGLLELTNSIELTFE